MASFKLNGLANSSFQETEFADPIRNAIKKKHLGDLDVRDLGTPELGKFTDTDTDARLYFNNIATVN